MSKFNLDELCRLRSDLKTGDVVGSTLRYQYQIDRYIKALDDVIGADMSPKGEWIYHEEPDYSTEDDCIVYYQCSVCGRRIYSSTVNAKDYPFCHCGADMRKEEENDNERNN